MTCKECRAVIRKGSPPATLAESHACVNHINGCTKCAKWLLAERARKQEQRLRRLGPKKFLERQIQVEIMAKRQLDRMAADPELGPHEDSQ